MVQLGAAKETDGRKPLKTVENQRKAVSLRFNEGLMREGRHGVKPMEFGRSPSRWREIAGSVRLLQAITGC
jgi:hypothetical protein